jgi:hypothetical protein
MMTSWDLSSLSSSTPEEKNQETSMSLSAHRRLLHLRKKNQEMTTSLLVHCHFLHLKKKTKK